MLRASVLLCDHAQVADNKLFISGGGIDVINATAPSAIAVLVFIPWSRANEKIGWKLRLISADSDHVLKDGTPVEIAGQLEVGRPPGSTTGAALPVPLAINFSPLGLPPDRYIWELTVETDANPLWLAPFQIV